jgi:hypothetical protein
VTSAFATFDVPIVDKVAVRTVAHTFGTITRDVALPVTFPIIPAPALA